MSSPLRILAKDDLETVAFKVCTALDKKGIHAVLTGGSAATVYAPTAHLSEDVDFIASFYGRSEQLSEALEEIGYISKDRIYLSLEGNIVSLDFPDEEILIGSEGVSTTAKKLREEMVLHILTPTDCVKDRLASFYWYQDRQALAAAIGVALNEDVDLNEIKRWSEQEGELQRFEEFSILLADRRH